MTVPYVLFIFDEMDSGERMLQAGRQVGKHLPTLPRQPCKEVTMGNDHPTLKFNYEALSALAARLGDHADAVMARRDTERDIRFACAALDRFITLKIVVKEIAQAADSAAIRHDLLAAIAAAERDGD